MSVYVGSEAAGNNKCSSLQNVKNHNEQIKSPRPKHGEVRVQKQGEGDMGKSPHYISLTKKPHLPQPSKSNLCLSKDTGSLDIFVFLVIPSSYPII